MNRAIYILLCISLIVNLYWGWYMFPSYYPKEVNIPNANQINNFCKNKGFEYGWLSSTSCGVDEVQCTSKVFDLIRYKCVKWVVE